MVAVDALSEGATAQFLSISMNLFASARRDGQQKIKGNEDKMLKMTVKMATRPA